LPFLDLLKGESGYFQSDYIKRIGFLIAAFSLSQECCFPKESRFVNWELLPPEAQQEIREVRIENYKIIMKDYFQYTYWNLRNVPLYLDHQIIKHLCL